MKHSTFYIFGLIAGSILLYHYTNLKRVEAGYFTDAFWITLNTFSYIIFFAVMTGFVVSELLKRTKKKSRR